MRKFFSNFDERKISTILNVVLVVSILIALFGFLRDLNNTIYYGQVDLRSRVTGGRLLYQDIDPYFYVWEEGDPDLYLNPTHDTNLPVSCICVTPTSVALHSFFSGLHFKIQKFLWLFLQWGFFLGSIALLANSTRVTKDSAFKSKLIWIIGLLFMSSGLFWRLHVERGQIIIVYIFFAVLAYWFINKSFRFSDVIGGFFLGFNLTLRPLWVFAGIPILIYRRWKVIVGMIIGFVSGMGLPLIYTKFSVWKQYYLSMQVWSKIHLGLIESVDYEYIRRTIEGMDNVWYYAVIPTADSSLQAIFKNYFNIGLSSNTMVILLAIFIVISIALLLIFRIDEKSMTAPMIFLIGTVVVYVSEFFVPAQRFSYYDMIWLMLLSLIVINTEKLRTLINPSLVFLFAGLFFSIFYFPVFPYGILISNIFILIYVIYNLILIYRSFPVRGIKLQKV